MNHSLNRLLTVSILSTSFCFSAHAAPTNYSPQNALIGVTSALQASAITKTSKSVTYGVIDTGITSSWIGFKGLSITSATCMNSGGSSANCRATVTNSDDHGHGSFVASEIIGSVSTSSATMSGIAPAGSKLVAVKALAANGSGSASDVANSIVYAVDRGAQVLNLSIGPSGTAAQQVAFFNSLASALNYAASKNALVVFAGGNAAQALANGGAINGLNDAAINHLLFVGSTNAALQKSSFSNTPGTASFTAKDTKKTYSYQSMWLMADGENIWGASNSPQGGYGMINQMSGTSMAAPQVAGVAGLLATRWPVLLTNGTIPQILALSAQDLGTKGLDSTYGNGLVRADLAMQSIGTMTVKTSPTSSMAVSQLTYTILTSGAFGSLSTLSTTLKTTTTFDMFSRDFISDLSGLIAKKTTTSSVASAVTAPVVKASGLKFADGSSLAFGSVEPQQNPVMGSNDAHTTPNWFASFSEASGDTMAAGYGFPASASFAEALWGNANAQAGEVTSLGISNSLLNLAGGGSFAAFGTQVSGKTRVAFSWSETAHVQDLASVALNTPHADALGMGITRQMTDNWKAGVTFNVLSEQNGLLGTTYLDNSAASFGRNHQSLSMGVSSGFALNAKTDLLFDAVMVRSDAASINSGLISDISPLIARSFGAALAKRDTFDKGDNLLVSLRKPLRVISGTASLSMTSVDGDGNATTTSQRVGLRPSGNETDFGLSYQAPLRDNLEWNLGFEARRDADNIAGNNDTTVRLGARLTF